MRECMRESAFHILHLSCALCISLGYTVPLESIGAFSAILPRWNCSLYLRFDLGKTSSNFFENSGFASVFCGQKYRGKE